VLSDRGTLSKRQRREPFWPDQAFKDVMTASAVVITLIALSVFFPPPSPGLRILYQRPSLLSPSGISFFFIKRSKYFTGLLEPVGVAGVPALLVLILLALPFLDRKPERDPFETAYCSIIAALLAAVLIALTIAGYISKPGSAETGVTCGNACRRPLHLKKCFPPVRRVLRKVQLSFNLMDAPGATRLMVLVAFIGPDLSNEGNQGRSTVA